MSARVEVADLHNLSKVCSESHLVRTFLSIIGLKLGITQKPE